MNSAQWARSRPLVRSGTVMQLCLIHRTSRRAKSSARPWRTQHWDLAHQTRRAKWLVLNPALGPYDPHHRTRRQPDPARVKKWLVLARKTRRAKWLVLLPFRHTARSVVPSLDQSTARGRSAAATNLTHVTVVSSE